MPLDKIGAQSFQAQKTGETRKAPPAPGKTEPSIPSKPRPPVADKSAWEKTGESTRTLHSGFDSLEAAGLSGINLEEGRTGQNISQESLDLAQNFKKSSGVNAGDLIKDAKMLYRYKDKSIAPALAMALNDPKTGKLAKIAIIKALGEMKDPLTALALASAGYDAMLTAARGDKDSEKIREACENALKNFPDEVKAQVKDLADKNKSLDGKTKTAAGFFLKKSGNKTAIPASGNISGKSMEIAEDFKQAKGEILENIISCAEKLYETDKTIGPALSSLLQEKDLDKGKKEPLIKLLGKIKDPSTIFSLINIAGSEDEYYSTRNAASEAIKKFSGEGEKYISGSSDKLSSKDKLSAMEYFRKEWTDPSTIKFFSQSASGNDKDLQKKGMESLWEVFARGRGILKEDDLKSISGHACEVAQKFAKYDTRENINILINEAKELYKEDKSVALTLAAIMTNPRMKNSGRVAAARALGELKDTRTALALKDTEDNYNASNELRKASQASLARIPDINKDGIKKLSQERDKSVIKDFKNLPPEKQKDILWNYRDLKTPEAIKMFIDACSSSDGTVKRRGIENLSKALEKGDESFKIDRALQKEILTMALGLAKDPSSEKDGVEILRNSVKYLKPGEGEDIETNKELRKQVLDLAVKLTGKSEYEQRSGGAGLLNESAKYFPRESAQSYLNAIKIAHKNRNQDSLRSLSPYFDTSGKNSLQDLFTQIKSDPEQQKEAMNIFKNIIGDSGYYSGTGEGAFKCVKVLNDKEVPSIILEKLNDKDPEVRKKGLGFAGDYLNDPRIISRAADLMADDNTRPDAAFLLRRLEDRNRFSEDEWNEGMKILHQKVSSFPEGSKARLELEKTIASIENPMEGRKSDLKEEAIKNISKEAMALAQKFIDTPDNRDLTDQALELYKKDKTIALSLSLVLEDSRLKDKSRESAAGALGALGDPGTIPVLLKNKYGYNEKIRKASDEGLKKNPALTETYLLENFKDLKPDIQGYALEHLKGSKDPRLIKCYLQASGSSDKYLRERSASYLLEECKSGERYGKDEALRKEILETALRFTKDSDFNLRWKGREILLQGVKKSPGEGTRNYLKALKDSLNNPDPDFRKDLLNISSQEDMKKLYDTINSDPELKKEALSILEEIINRAPADERMSYVNGKSREQAFRALSYIKDPRATEFVLEKLNSSDRNMKLDALELAELFIKDPGVKKIVSNNLNSQDPDIKKAALNAAGQSMDPDYIEKSVGDLDNDNEKIREEVFNNISKLGDGYNKFTPEERLQALSILRTKRTSVKEGSLAHEKLTELIDKIGKVMEVNNSSVDDAMKALNDGDKSKFGRLISSMGPSTVMALRYDLEKKGTSLPDLVGQIREKDPSLAFDIEKNILGFMEKHRTSEGIRYDGYKRFSDEGVKPLKDDLRKILQTSGDDHIEFFAKEAFQRAGKMEEDYGYGKKGNLIRAAFDLLEGLDSDGARKGLTEVFNFSYRELQDRAGEIISKLPPEKAEKLLPLIKDQSLPLSQRTGIIMALGENNNSPHCKKEASEYVINSGDSELKSKLMSNFRASPLSDRTLERLSATFAARLSEAIQNGEEGSDFHKLGQLLAAREMAKNEDLRDHVNLDEVNKKINELLIGPLKGKIEEIQRKTVQDFGGDNLATEQEKFLKSKDFQKRISFMSPEEKEKYVTKELQKLAALSPEKGRSACEHIVGQEIVNSAPSILGEMKKEDRNKGIKTALGEILKGENISSDVTERIGDAVASLQDKSQENLGKNLIKALEGMKQDENTSKALEIVRKLNSEGKLQSLLAGASLISITANNPELQGQIKKSLSDDILNYGKFTVSGIGKGYRFLNNSINSYVLKTTGKLPAPKVLTAVLGSAELAAKVGKFAPWMSFAGALWDAVGSVSEFSDGNTKGGILKGTSALGGVAAGFGGLMLLQAAAASAPVPPLAIILAVGGTVVCLLTWALADSEEEKFIKKLGVWK